MTPCQGSRALSGQLRGLCISCDAYAGRGMAPAAAAGADRVWRCPNYRKGDPALKPAAARQEPAGA